MPPRVPSRSRLSPNTSTIIQPQEFVDKLNDLNDCTENLHKSLVGVLQPKAISRSNAPVMSTGERATLALRCCNACLKSLASVSKSKDSNRKENQHANLIHLVSCARTSLSILRELEDSLPTKSVDICRATLKFIEECNLTGFSKSALMELISLHSYLCRLICPDGSMPLQVPPNKPQGILVHSIPKDTISSELANVQSLYFQLSIRTLLSLSNVDLLALSSVLSVRGSLISQLSSLRQSLPPDQYANGTLTLYRLLCRATTSPQDNTLTSSAHIHFKIRAKALMLLNYNHNLELDVWWSQGWKFGLSFLRSAEDALTPYTNDVKPFWLKMVEFSKSQNKSKFINGKGWVEFCEGWMSVAKKLEDFATLKMLADLLSSGTESENDDNETEKLTSTLSSLNISNNVESIFTKCNVVMLTATAKLASQTVVEEFNERDYSKLQQVLESLSSLDVDHNVFLKVERSVDGLRKVLYNKISEAGGLNKSNENLFKLHEKTVSWTETQLKKSKSVSPPLLYGTLDSLLQLAQFTLSYNQISINYLNRSLNFIDPLKSPQANRLIASAFWNWSCTLFQDGKAGTEADCIPAVEECIKVAEDGILMCDESIARHKGDNSIKGDMEMRKIMIDQRPKRYELLAICYTKVHNNQVAYNAFCDSIISSLQTSSSPINEKLESLPSNHPFSNLVKRAMQIGLSQLMLPSHQISFNDKADKANISHNVKCALIELQIQQIEERAWSRRDACSAVIHMLVELIGPSGYNVNEHPLRKAKVLLRLMEQIILGPSVNVDLHVPAPEILFEEVRSIIQRQDFGKDDIFKNYSTGYMLMAHMLLAIYYYRSSDTALQGSSSALRESRQTKEILKSILGTGGRRKSSILRDNNLISNNKIQEQKPQQPERTIRTTRSRPVPTRQQAPSLPSSSSTRTTRTRTTTSTANKEKSQPVRNVRSTSITRRIVKPVNSQRLTKESEDKANNLSNKCEIDDIERCFDILQILTEMLGILGHTFLRLDFLKLLRKLCQNEWRSNAEASEDYLITSTSLAAEYVKLGKTCRAGSVFTQVANSTDGKSNSKSSESWLSAQIEFTLRYSEYLAVIGNVDKSLVAYNEAKSLKDLLDEINVNKEINKNSFIRTLNIERSAIAATVYARIAYNREDIPSSLKSLAQSLRLWNNAARQLIKMSPKVEEVRKVENDDPFAMPIDDKENENEKKKVKVHNNVFENRKCTGIHWRVSQALLECLIMLSKLYIMRGTSKEANYFLDQAYELTNSLASPNFNAKINALKAELSLALNNLDESRKQIDEALNSIGGQDDNESSVLIKKVKGDLQFKLQSNSDASAGYLSACLILERLDKSYNEGENLIMTPTKSKKNDNDDNSNNHDIDLNNTLDPLLPKVFGHLLRQRIWLLSDEDKNNESQKLLDKLYKFSNNEENKSQENLLLGKMRLREAYNSFQTDLFMSSLSDALISMPCGTITSNTNNTNSLNTRKPSIETLVDAEKYLINALDINFDRLSVKDVRQCCLSIGLIRAFQTSLGKINKNNSTLAATYLDLGSNVSLRRELMEVIDNKIEVDNQSRNDLIWPMSNEENKSKNETPLHNKFNKRLYLPSPSPLSSPMSEDNSINIGSEEELNLNEYWASIKRRYENDKREPENLINETMNEIPNNWKIISISITDDKKTMFVVKYRKKSEPLVLSLPLDNRQNRREGGGEEGDFTYLTAANELKSILNESDESIKDSNKVKTDDEKIDWWNNRKHLDSRLRQLCKNIEFCWLGVFKTIFKFTNVTKLNEEDVKLNELRNCLDKVFKRHIHLNGRKKMNSKIKLDDSLLECFSTLQSDCKDEELEDLIYFVLDIHGFQGIQLALAEIDIDQAVIDIRQALDEFNGKFNNNNNSNVNEEEEEHTFLILDKMTQSFPWECIPSLRGRSVSRIPSISFLKDRIEYNKMLKNVDVHKFYVNPKSTYCLINPSGDLNRTQKSFDGWFKEMKKLGWKGISGREPLEVELSNGLENKELFIYFGHGGGQKYIRSQKIKNLKNCSTSLLWGCSSGSLKDLGDFDSYGNPSNYLLGGCPCLVANLWDVTDRDIDRLSQSVFDRIKLNYDSIVNEEIDEKYSLTKAVAQSRKDCRLKYLTGAAPVIYGIPIYLKL